MRRLFDWAAGEGFGQAALRLVLRHPEVVAVVRYRGRPAGMIRARQAHGSQARRLRPSGSDADEDGGHSDGEGADGAPGPDPFDEALDVTALAP
jgi:hypothetical protein